MTLHAIENATVWLASGRPARLVWRGRRWRVTDTPTALTEPVYDERLTHGSVPQQVGWRFQATDDAGHTHVVDARQATDGWAVVAVYD
jgi:thymidine kinase